jgi:hypothetical protein
MTKNNKIYKTCTPGLSDEHFATYRCSGLSSFISFERLTKTDIKTGIGLKPTERIVGMVIDYDGITVYLETIQ